MAVRKVNSVISISRSIKPNLIRQLIIFLLLYNIFPPQDASGQKGYDEISVFIEVPGFGSGEIAAVIEGQNLYLPVSELFDFLKIKNVSSQDMETISGFFINPEATYDISRTIKKIRYIDNTFDLQDGDLIKTESNLYLKSTYFGKVFGLDCVFNFRSLSVKINSKLELPVIKEMRQEEMRKNLTRLKGGNVADTIIGRTYPLFKFGMADWSVTANEEIDGKSETVMNLSLGSMIAGGEANASINYNSLNAFSEKQQYYLWRYVNNDLKPLRQIMAGKIATNTISSVFNPILGVQFTNTPTTYRRSFGSYTLSDNTEPGWIVELYVNGVMVDYVKADASGFFTFEVPLVYGNSVVKLKFFGPWGEERTREQNINIPFSFLPEKTMEYTVSAGIVEDSSGSRYSKVDLKYGLSGSLTIGAGFEYLSSIISNPSIPYIYASLRITNNLMVTGEYALGIRAKGSLSYRLPSSLQLDLNYTLYDKDQKAISYNYKEERKAVLSIPSPIGKYSFYQKFTFYQIVLPNSKFTTGEWMFSGGIGGINTNLTTYALIVDRSQPYMYSNLSLAFRLRSGIVIMPQAQYGFSQNELISAKISLEKHLLKNAFFNLSYEQLFSNHIHAAEAGLRYDFSFAQTGASVRQSDRRTTLIQYARGSLLNDTKSKYFGTGNRTNVGKGGIILSPFLDLNANGRRDAGEIGVQGLNLHVNGGRIERSDADTTIRILDLEPYTSCYIELDGNNFENIAWRVPKRALNVVVDPDILKFIEIPVTVAGEASGNIFIKKGIEKTGLARIIITFESLKLKKTVKTLSEEDGYFNYFGLAPGNYTVKIDSVQLKKLNMSSEPASRQITISAGANGDIADGLEFVLRKNKEE